MFALGCQADPDPYLIGQVALSMGRVYVLEALGTIAVGIPFTYLSIPYLYSLQIVLLLSGLNLLSAGLVWAWPDVATRKRLGLNLRPNADPGPAGCNHCLAVLPPPTHKRPSAGLPAGNGLVPA